VAEAPLLEVQSLVKEFSTAGTLLNPKARIVRAVDNLNFRVERGTTFALVGESGCGKSTTANMILLLETPSSGRILFHGEDIAQRSAAGLTAYRKAVQAVFQDPYSSLSPRMRVRDIVGEPLRIHERLSGKALSLRVGELLEHVGLSPDKAAHYPHQFSGGQRQRIAIARALSLNPELIVLDEPVSALDVSIRAHILNLLSDLQEQLGLSYLLISHDLAIVEHMSDQVAVMYSGQIMETAGADELYGNPIHPYTRSLIAAVPNIDPDIPLNVMVKDEIPNAPSHAGCRFHARCPFAGPDCAHERPELVEAVPSHLVQYCSERCTPLASAKPRLSESAVARPSAVA
jgi:oligopeptide/dipeptide ABC transporter ATP-binding protein